jgi:hypothetical protein
MKDYTEQIISILMSDLKQDHLVVSDRGRTSGLIDISKVAKSINSLIQSEIYELESHIVDLTEQLFETDRLMMETNKSPLLSNSYMKSVSGNKREGRTKNIRTYDVKQ